MGIELRFDSPRDSRVDPETIDYLVFMFVKEGLQVSATLF